MLYVHIVSLSLSTTQLSNILTAVKQNKGTCQLSHERGIISPVLVIILLAVLNLTVSVSHCS